MSGPGDDLRILTYYIADLPLRDQRETMERPFFSLSKRRRMKPINYRSPDGKLWIKVSPHQDHGMATIWDADVLIWATSQIIEAQRQGKPGGRQLDMRTQRGNRERTVEAMFSCIDRWRYTRD